MRVSTRPTQCPILTSASEKRPLSRWRPVSCVSSGHFRVQVPFTSHIVGSLFPKEQVPASTPHPHEVGTTLTPIVAFPCGRTESARILWAVAGSTLCSGERRGRYCDREIALVRAMSGGAECSVPRVVVLAGTRQKKSDEPGFVVRLDALPHKEECYGRSAEDGYRCASRCRGRERGTGERKLRNDEGCRRGGNQSFETQLYDDEKKSLNSRTPTSTLRLSRQPK